MLIVVVSPILLDLFPERSFFLCMKMFFIAINFSRRLREGAVVYAATLAPSLLNEFFGC
jgi:hypothetical protein